MMTCLFTWRTSGIEFSFLAIFFIQSLWLTGCSTKMEMVITSREEPKAKTVAAERAEKGITEESLYCISCHKECGVTYGGITDWDGSIHARKGVGCEACHVNSAPEPERRDADELAYLSAQRGNCEDEKVYRRVSAGTCGKCHSKEYNEFLKSRHSTAWRKIQEYEQFAALPGDVRASKCGQCHNIQFTCNSCHTRHTFTPAGARSPEACRTCHTGPDQPYYDIYISSKHGAVHTAGQTALPKESQSIYDLRSPVCVTCHMPQGTHNVSFGITHGPEEGNVSYTRENNIAAGRAETADRRDMVSICARCHTSSFAQEVLADADLLHKDVTDSIRKAKDIILGLEEDGILYLSSKELSDTPSLYHAIILGNLQTYHGRSDIVHFYNKLLCSATVASKGAYHMNFPYTYFYGLAELQKDMNMIRNEARRLQEEAEIKRKREMRLR
ncbi:MAG: hypothetical protein E3K32_11055 [wastewater metagenome]|nr:hypothetical protein [Candidatus Loosdrechtia aerotolerans]